MQTARPFRQSAQDEVHVIARRVVQGLLVVAFAIAGSHPGLAKGQKTSASGETLNQVLAKHTGQGVEAVEKACDRDNFMTSEEARAFGLVDEVVASRKEVPGLPEKSSVSA